MSALSITKAMSHSDAFGRWFKDTATWATWIAFLSALFALPMTEEQCAMFRQHTGRSEPPTKESKEAWLICGRRAGKSFMLALIAVFIACFREYRQHLSPGERGTILVIATDRKQARTIMRYIRGFLTETPMLKRLILSEAAESIELTNRIVIEVGTASFRSTRGYTFVAVLCDEIAFWPSDDESANPDLEILNAVRPGMATIPNAMLLCASSPFARRGALFDAFDRHWGVDGAPLVWKASTREMNSKVPQEFIDEQYAADAVKAEAEYGARFRNDLEDFIGLEEVRACIAEGVTVRVPRMPITGEMIRYHGFVDPSGGRHDAMTLAIAHDESRRDNTLGKGHLSERAARDIVVLDRVMEAKPPFRPEGEVAKFAATLKAYGISTVTGDNFGAQWIVDAFQRHGIRYNRSRLTRSQLYSEFLPQLNNGTVELLDLPDLTAQLTGLQRRTTNTGREVIDHKSGQHDDISNAVAGAVIHTIMHRKRGKSTSSYVNGVGVY